MQFCSKLKVRPKQVCEELDLKIDFPQIFLIVSLPVCQYIFLMTISLKIWSNWWKRKSENDKWRREGKTDWKKNKREIIFFNVATPCRDLLSYYALGRNRSWITGSASAWHTNEQGLIAETEKKERKKDRKKEI